MPKFPAEYFYGATVSSTSLEPVPSSCPPQSLRAIFESPGARSRPRSRPLRAPIFPNLSWSRRQPCRPCPQAYNTIPEPATMSSSPSLRRCAPHTIPEPTTPMTRIIPRPVASSSSPSPRRLEPMMPLNPRHP
jgi:hypothetical protein